MATSEERGRGEARQGKRIKRHQVAGIQSVNYKAVMYNTGIWSILCNNFIWSIKCERIIRSVRDDL